ncbi:MAG: GNAT family N-acetyltransferase [Terriglobia bacterium]|jgi:ribosomal protein S18 acetylase RimI-like enzyme
MSPEPIPPSLTITPAQEPEFEWCAQLMAGTDPWITLHREIKQCRATLRRPGRELFVAREASQPVGFILIHPYGCAGSPYIASVAVAESARGKGIGAQLLAFAERQAVGRRFIFLCVSSFNRRAQELYYRLGYKQVGELPNYVVEGHSELLLSKRLA